MKKFIRHALIPNTTEVLCGEKSHYANALYREQVTCKKCRKHPDFKNTMWRKMPNKMARDMGYRKPT